MVKKPATNLNWARPGGAPPLPLKGAVGKRGPKLHPAAG